MSDIDLYLNERDEAEYEAVFNKMKTLSYGKILVEDWDEAATVVNTIMNRIGLKKKHVEISIESHPIFLKNGTVVRKYFVVKWE